MRYAFIARHRPIWPVSRQCRLLKVSRSGFHEWHERAPSARALYDARLTARIRSFHLLSARSYGSPRLWRDLVEAGERVGENRVARLMRRAGRRCGAGDAVRSMRGRGRNARSPATFSIASSKRALRTRSGWPTLPTSTLPRAGSTWPWCSISSRGASWAGR